MASPKTYPMGWVVGVKLELKLNLGQAKAELGRIAFQIFALQRDQPDIPGTFTKVTDILLLDY